MIRSQFKVALILVAVLMIVSIGAKSVGALQPPNPALRGFIEGCENKPQPCWYGIVPNVTRYEVAKRKLESLNYRVIADGKESIFYSSPSDTHFECTIYMRNMDFTTRSPSNILHSMVIVCPATMLGDIIALRGAPERLGMSIGYDEGKMTISTMNDNDFIWYISLFDRFSTIGFTMSMSEVGNGTQWHGFVPQWRYCQLEPDSLGCPN